jgi:hypothetical protein
MRSERKKRLQLAFPAAFLWFFLFPKKERTKGVWGKAPLLRHGLQPNPDLSG